MEVCDEALGVTLGRTTSSADLGGKCLSPIVISTHIIERMLTVSLGSSKYSNENFED